MKDIMQDKYILGQSQSGIIGTVGEEIRLDLSLDPNTNNLTGGKIHGKVTTSTGDPIENALIKIMSSNFDPLIHDLTDVNGDYSFTNISPNSTYNIFAVASGMKTNQGNQFTVSEYENITINFTMEEDSAMSLCVVAGDLVDQSNNNPVEGAIISLYKINSDNTQTLQAITYTNQYGQYVFREVLLGDYIVKISALGYNPTEANISLSEQGQLLPMNVSIIQNVNTSRGTVSGIITDNNNQPINRADVILYKVETDSSLTPMAFTKTNIAGIYLFANVEPGEYKVKSNEIEIVSVDIPDPWTYSPNFDYFMISPYSTIYVSSTTSTLEKITSKNEIPPGYIGGIGESGGTATLTMNVPNSGMYVFGIQYLSGDTSRIMKIDINGTPTGETYTFPQTNSWNSVDAKIFYVYINLNEGSNTIKFYNSPDAFAPWVGMLSFNQIVSISAITGEQDGTQVGGAVIPGYVGGIGDTGASLTINFNVPLAGQYVLAIQHLNGDADRILKIDVNGTPTGETYTFPQTNGWTATDFSIFYVDVDLNQGSNSIKFYNSPNAPGPWISMLIIAPIISKSGTTGQMANGAFILGDNNDFVGAIGDDGGTLTIDFNASYAGKYILGIQHLNEAEDRIMKIDVNGTSTGEIYTFPMTNSWHTPDATIFNVNIDLIAGLNTIKFYNSPNAPAPWVGMLDLKPNAQIMYYDATSATLEGSAKIENGMVTGIGANLGSLNFTTTVLSEGIYDFTIGYVASDDNKKSKIAVNTIPTGQIYSFSQTTGLTHDDIRTKIVPLTLKSGTNDIKIYNEL